MTDILDTVKAALAEATPGGWYWDSRNGNHYLCTANPDKYVVVLGWPCGIEQGTFFTDDERGAADANLVQMAPTWLRALVAEVERLRHELTLAIEHDRQPYPTAEAYRAVCVALHAREADLAALRQRHAEAVEAAFREGYNRDTYPIESAWRESAAKARIA